jgi:hypothetical protein
MRWGIALYAAKICLGVSKPKEVENERRTPITIPPTEHDEDL